MGLDIFKGRADVELMHRLELDPDLYEDYEDGGYQIAEDTDAQVFRSGYGVFSLWRNSLTVAAGLSKMGEYGPERIVMDWDEYEPKNLLGEWDEGTEPDDPLFLLIVHSDCDGYLLNKYLTPIADRLTDLLPHLPEETAYPTYMYERTERFIAAARSAAEEGYDLLFL